MVSDFLVFNVWLDDDVCVRMGLRRADIRSVEEGDDYTILNMTGMDEVSVDETFDVAVDETFDVVMGMLGMSVPTPTRPWTWVWEDEDAVRARRWLGALS